MRMSIGILLLIMVSAGCSGEEPAKTNTHRKTTTQARESASARQENKAAADSSTDREIKKVTLDRDATYGSTDSVVVGEIASFAVDAQRRVFIADRGQTTIQVFNPDGSYRTSLGRQGHGPAEFAAVLPKTIIKIQSSRLYVPDYVNAYDFFPIRVQIFSLDSLSFIRTVTLLAANKVDYHEVGRYYPDQIYPRHDGTFLVSYRRLSSDYRDSTSYIRYMVQDHSGDIISGPILEQQDRTNLVYKVKNAPIPYLAITPFPFYGKSLLAVSDNGYLYAANNTEDFKIDVYNKRGKHLRSFQHAFPNIPLTRSGLIDRYKKKGYKPQGVTQSMIRQAQNLPKTWPALESMFFDDQNRLWVSTIIDNHNLYKWWVLTKSGKVVAQFKWPRDKPIKAVRNGYLYTKETDKQGIETVVRYTIAMQ